MLGLFVIDKNENFAEIVNNFTDLDTKQPKIVFFNELLPLPKSMPGMFAVNIWNLKVNDSVVCCDKTAALYLSKVPAPNKIAFGFDYEGFTRIDSFGDLDNE